MTVTDDPGVSANGPEESPFTLRGHDFAPTFGASLAGQPTALPPKDNNPASPANYWVLDEQLITNMQLTVTPLDPSVPVFKEPHIVITGTVEKVIHEQDGDHHLWVTLDNSKFQLACEIVPQNVIPDPAIGDHVKIWGILRYDLQHGWWEIHPVDYLAKV